MLRELCSIVAFIVLLATPALAFRGNFLGHWVGRPSYTPMGPLNGVFNFTVEHEPTAILPTFLMSNTFNGYEAHGSNQQFWVEFNADNSQSTLTYCGVIYNFFEWLTPATVKLQMNQTVNTETQMEWYLSKDFDYGPARWTLTLLNGGSQLRSHFRMPENVEHFDVIYDRVTGDQRNPSFLPSNSASTGCSSGMDGEHLDVDLNRVKPFKLDSDEFPKICTNWPSSETLDELHDKPGGNHGAGSCPFGFGKKKKKETVKQRALSFKHRGNSVKTLPSTSYLGYENCYKVNEYLNYTVRWTWNNATRSIDVVFSATAPPDMEIESSYVALGIMPDFPLMRNMDIIMGHFSQDGTHYGCVRSMYADRDVGTPVANPDQQLSDTKLWIEGSTMYVQFTRPWNTGHHDLTKPPDFATLVPVISYALGRAGDTCESKPAYHSGLRGTYGFWFPNASYALSDYMKCK